MKTAKEQVYICKTELLRFSHAEQPLGAPLRCFPSELAEQDSQMDAGETGRAANTKCQSIQQAVLNNAAARIVSSSRVAQQRKKSQVQELRQAERTGPDLQLTHLIPVQVQQHTLSQPVNSSFTLQILQNYSNSWILVSAVWPFVAFSGTEVQLGRDKE